MCGGIFKLKLLHYPNINCCTETVMLATASHSQCSDIHCLENIMWNKLELQLLYDLKGKIYLYSTGYDTDSVESASFSPQLAPSLYLCKLLEAGCCSTGSMNHLNPTNIATGCQVSNESFCTIFVLCAFRQDSKIQWNHLRYYMLLYIELNQHLEEERGLISMGLVLSVTSV